MEWLVPGERVCRVTEAIEVREAIEKFYSAILGRTAESERGEGRKSAALCARASARANSRNNLITNPVDRGGDLKEVIRPLRADARRVSTREFVMHQRRCKNG